MVVLPLPSGSAGYPLAMLSSGEIEALREHVEKARAARRQPELLRAYAALGAGYLAAGRLDEAESAWRTAIQQARVMGDPTDLGRALLGLARTLARTERTDRALLHYTEAIHCLAACDEAAREAAASEMAALGRVPGGAR